MMPLRVWHTESLPAATLYDPVLMQRMDAGFVTTGLELWAALPCGAKHFRQRLWGTLNMPQVNKCFPETLLSLSSPPRAVSL
jgi:hypothetical protein